MLGRGVLRYLNQKKSLSRKGEVRSNFGKRKGNIVLKIIKKYNKKFIFFLWLLTFCTFQWLFCVCAWVFKGLQNAGMEKSRHLTLLAVWFSEVISVNSSLCGTLLVLTKIAWVLTIQHHVGISVIRKHTNVLFPVLIFRKKSSFKTKLFVVLIIWAFASAS
jgi:hypothetical protein